MRVFGLDPVRDPVGVLVARRLPERGPRPARLDAGRRVAALPAGLLPDAGTTPSPRTCGGSSSSIPAARIKNLSQGQRARVGLLAALAYRPELLVLDEPSTGLDPIVRRDILAAIIRTIAEEGRTVLFSSHLLDEVERVSDHVAMIDRGRIVLCEPTRRRSRQSHRRLTLRFRRAACPAAGLRGRRGREGSGREWTAVCRGSRSRTSRDGAARFGARIVEEHTPSLDEIFVARVGSPHLVAEGS